jgi:hypothetical protein
MHYRCLGFWGGRCKVLLPRPNSYDINADSEVIQVRRITDRLYTEEQGRGLRPA